MKKLILLLVVLLAFFSCGGGSETPVVANTEPVVTPEEVVEENLNPTFSATVVNEGGYLVSNDENMKLIEELKLGESVMVEAAKIKGYKDNNKDTPFYIVRQDADGEEVDGMTWEWNVILDTKPAVVVDEDVLYNEADFTATTQFGIYPLQVVAVHENSKKDGYVKISYFSYFNDDSKAESDEYVLGEMLAKRQSWIKADKFVLEENLSYAEKDIKAARALYLVNDYDWENEADAKQVRVILEGTARLGSIFQDEIDKRLNILNGANEVEIEEPADSAFGNGDAVTVSITALTPAFAEPSADADMITSFKEGDVLMYVETVETDNGLFVKVTDGQEYFYVSIEDTSISEP